jgi:hypothetical protein
MDKDETIKKLADALFLMTQCFAASCDGTPQGKAMDDSAEALSAAYQHGWSSPLIDKMIKQQHN